MAALNTDLLIIKRGAAHFKTTVADVLALGAAITVTDNLTSTSSTAALSAGQGKILSDRIDGLGDIVVAANIAARDALTGLDVGDIIHILDAGSGKWSREQVTANGDGAYLNATTVVIATQDSLANGLVATALGVTPSPTGLTITNTSGADAAIPLADATNAGLMTPAEKAAVAASTAAQHGAVTVAATSTMLGLTGQELSFDIGALADAP